MITEKIQPVVTELFNSGRKLKIYLVFIIYSYFPVPKNVRPNTVHFFTNMKILKKREIQQIHIDHSPDIDFKDLMDL